MSLKLRLCTILALSLFTLGAEVRAEERSCLSASEVYAAMAPAVVDIRVKNKLEIVWSGTGTVITRDGDVLTTDHIFPQDVVKSGYLIEVVDIGGKTFNYTVSARLPGLSLSQAEASAPRNVKSLLLSPVGTFPPAFLPVAYKKPEIGELVYTVGYPANLGLYITTGIVATDGQPPNSFDPYLAEDALFLADSHVIEGMSGSLAVNCRLEMLGTVWAHLGFFTPAAYSFAYKDIPELFKIKGAN